MNVEIEAQYNRNLKFIIHTNNPEKMKNVLNGKGNGHTYVGTYTRARKFLQSIFENHSEFYEYVGFDAGNKHGGSGTSFYTDGFSQFLTDCFDSKKYSPDGVKDKEIIKIFTDACAEKIGDLIEEFEENSNSESYKAKSMVSTEGAGNQRLTDPEFIDESLILTKENAYKLNVQEIKHATNIEEIEENMKEEIRNVYSSQVKARTKAMKARINDLETKLREEQNQVFVDALQMVGELENWEVDGNYLVYKDKIHPEYVQKKYTNGNPVKLTPEAREKFYIKGLKVKIRKKIRKPKYEDAYHPHALSNGFCTGNWKKPLREALDDVVNQLKHIDLHSRGHNDAERDLKDNFEEYTVDPEETEVEKDQETLGKSENPNNAEKKVWEN